MLSDIVNNLILVNLALLFCSFYQILITSYSKTAISIYKISFIFNSIIFAILTWAFLYSDFSIENVFLFSSTILPTMYKIGAIWSSSQGSMLFFTFLFSLISIISLYYNNLDEYGKRIFTMLSAAICFIFLSNIYLFNNPFISLKSSMHQGMGLTAVLQDAALLIHPPILYLGYIFLFPPMAFAVIILFKADYLKKLLPKILLWSKFSWGFLTIGITLGSLWAYRELGWGGYWFFDPVENASLLPWLMVTQLYHCCLISIKSQKFYKTTISFAILSFCMVLLSIFFVRSGLLVSVHSFANDPLSCIYLFCSLAVFIFYALAILLLNIHKMDQNKTYAPDSLIKISIILFISASVIILTSIIYPLSWELLGGQKVTIGIEFFINILLPIFCLIALLASFIYNKKSYFIICTIFSIIAIIFLVKLQIHFVAAIGLLCSSALIISSILLLFYKTDRGIIKVSKIFLGHFGYACLILFITLNSILQEEINFSGKENDAIIFRNLNIKLHDVTYSQQDNYYKQQTNFWINIIDSNKYIILSPENRLYKIENTMLPEVAIKHFWFYDLYSILNFSKDDTINVTFYYKPFMSFIWFSIVLISLGILL